MRLGLIFFLPAFLLLCALLLWPCLQVVWLSFTKTSLLRPERTGAFAGIGNYLWLYAHAEFWIAVTRSVVLTVSTTVVSIALSYVIAVFLNRDFAGKPIVYVALFLPWAISDVITAFIFRWNYDMAYGITNYVLVDVLHVLSAPVSWLGTAGTAMPAVIVALVWRFMPFSTLVILAALKQVPDVLIDAARIDGTSLLSLHTRVIIPSMKAPLVILTTLRIGAIFRSFDLTWLLTRGGPGDATNILPIFYYRMAFEGMEVGKGAAVAVHIFAFVFLVYYVIYCFFGKDAFSH
jgi:multiple sugar transport system permease protein